MSHITFKFFTPRGDCRRVTYDDVPELATINELVDGMVGDRRSLSYRDSEGDLVVLKTSRDVVEAVKDARDSGVKSIKVQIRLVRECPRKNGSKAAATTANNNNNNNDRSHCGGAGRRRANCHRPQWGRYWSRGLFGNPHRNTVDLEGVSNEVEEIFKHFAPFFRIPINDTDDEAEEAKEQAAERPSSGSENHPSDEDDHPVPKETAEQAEETKKAPSLRTIEEKVEEEGADDADASASFTFVQNEVGDHGKAEEVGARELEENANNDDGIDDKLKLLKEMGFEIPQSVARKMIRELNGRMDLIVRALVANEK